MAEILPLLIGGIVLFLYAITQLSEGLQGIFSESAKNVIERYTSHLLSAIIIGTLLTIILQSSSAVIILVIVFINAKALTFKQAVGIIMGANIGTTFSSQLIALDIGKYSIFPLLVGLVIKLFVKSKSWKAYGHVLFYFGMLFFGLFVMENSVDPLRGSDVFISWLERVEGNELHGALMGGLITLIIQSSSGTVGMAIVLGKQNLLSIAGGISIMLGAELGTCSDTLLATINGSRQAIKAGLFHLLFNLSTIIIGLFLFEPFTGIVKDLSFEQDIGKTIANAHMLFNIFGVLLFLPLVSPVVQWMGWLIPEKEV